MVAAGELQLGELQQILVDSGSIGAGGDVGGRPEQQYAGPPQVVKLPKSTSSEAAKIQINEKSQELQYDELERMEEDDEEAFGTFDKSEEANLTKDQNPKATNEGQTDLKEQLQDPQMIKDDK